MSASRWLKISALAVAVVSLLPLYAAAQQAPGDDGVVRLDAVKVTVERRSEDSKDVPVSASVLRPEFLDAISTSGSDIRVLAGKAPSLNIESSNGRVFPRVYIRGYGNTDFNTYASQPVSLIYDDVVQENAFLKGFPIFDLEGLEVLRGPQGTLFGRNTPAGVVKFNSVKPTIGANDGYASLSYGTYGTMTLESGLSIAMGDHWAARLSTLGQRRDDWVENRDGRDLEGYTDSAVRLQLLYQASDDFSALFNAHARHLDGTARLFRANIIQPGTNQLVDGFDAEKSFIDGGNRQELQTYGGSANLTWDLGDIALHSITAYEGIGKYYSRGDIDGGFGAVFAPPSGPGVIPFPVETAGGIKSLDQYSQEVRAESQYDGPLNWQAGLYYFHDDVEGVNYTYNTLSGGDLASYQLTRQLSADPPAQYLLGGVRLVELRGHRSFEPARRHPLHLRQEDLRRAGAGPRHPGRTVQRADRQLQGHRRSGGHLLHQRRRQCVRTCRTRFPRRQLRRAVGHRAADRGRAGDGGFVRGRHQVGPVRQPRAPEL